jgi:hypothetical protein
LLFSCAHADIKTAVLELNSAINVDVVKMPVATGGWDYIVSAGGRRGWRARARERCGRHEGVKG